LALGKVADMQTAPTSEPTGSRPIDPPASPTRRKLLARLLSALRGDKYMVGAYPPEKER
jgi:hypothetical protein